MMTLPAMAADYASEVAPLMKKRCAGCHGAAQAQSGLRLDSAPAMLEGGYTGPVIVRGQSAKSPLMERVLSNKEGLDRKSVV